MTITLGNNITSLTAQRRLAESTDALSRTFESLSSGMRINRASDDAAGLAIADSLRADSRIITQAIRNVNDGISMLAIQENALQAVSQIATRIAELAEQSANGIYTSKQREALDKEAQSLWSEAIRISQTTKFNGINLLSGTPSDVRMQVGTNSSATSSIAIQTGSNIFQATSYSFDGSLEFAGEFSATGRTNHVHLADFDGDGNLDTVAGGNSGSSLDIFFGNGDGTFKAKTSYGGNNQDLAVGDVDNDGDIDIGYIDSGATLNILRNSGSGTFSLITGPAAGTTASYGSSFFRDINSDGKLDWINIDTANEVVWTVLGNGDGTFKASVSHASGIDIEGGDIGDFNEDGSLDILVTANAAGSDKIYFGNLNGSFTAATTTVTQPLFSHAVDINNDGHLDIIGTDGPFSSTVSLRLGNGDGTFKVSNVAISSDGVNGDRGFADIDGDGNIDIFRPNPTGSFGLSLGNGDGTFKAGISVNTGSTPSVFAYGMDTGDLNNDGVLDFITPTINSDSIISVLSGSTPSTSALSFSLSTTNASRTAIDTFTNLLSEITKDIGKIGAYQSRLETALQNNQAARENYLAAEARIRNADIAFESATMARQQILQNTASAVLAQANQQPTLALQLLKL